MRGAKPDKGNFPLYGGLCLKRKDGGSFPASVAKVKS